MPPPFLNILDHSLELHVFMYRKIFYKENGNNFLIAPKNRAFVVIQHFVRVFQFGSWSYKVESVIFDVVSDAVFLDDFYDNQEWILLKSSMKSGIAVYNTTHHQENYSTVIMELSIQREHFYYIFNLMIPTTLVTVVAVVGFHAPSNSGPRRETKFRLGIMTLLSMGVMLLMVVEDMPKFSFASIPGQRGSFSDVPILGIYYIFLIFCISTCTCTTSIFVILERYALEHPEREKIPKCLLWLDFNSPSPCTLIFFGIMGRRKKRRERDREMVIDIEPDEKQLSFPEPETLDDRSMRFGERRSRQPSVETRPSPRLEYLHTTTSEQSIRPPPLHPQRNSWSRRSGSKDPLETLSKPLDRMADTLAVISQRLLTLQSKMESVRPQMAPYSTASGNLTERSFDIQISPRRQAAANRGQPILTTKWHRIISRLEILSLSLYLLGILSMIFLVVYHSWY